MCFETSLSVGVLQHTVIHCNTLQYTAIHCNTLHQEQTHTQRKSTRMCKKVNVQQGRTGDPTHQPRQDDRERPCRAGMLQAGPPPNLAPASLAQPLQTQLFF